VSVSEFPHPGNEADRPYRLVDTPAGVSLWWCNLGDDDVALPKLAEWLSPQEHARAQRFSDDALARRYVRGRAALRWILGNELGLAPDRVAIARGERGRPHIANANLDFNLSNTRNIAFVGLALDARVRIGVDVESVDRRLDHVGLARKFLTARENAALAALDEDERRIAFLRSWTCKEAMSKATGDALSAPLRAIEVELTPALRLVAGPPPYAPPDWQLHPAAVPEAFLATVALWQPARGDDRRARPATLDNGASSR
jgi:4'-phosphopantetheinyl transferase